MFGFLKRKKRYEQLSGFDFEQQILKKEDAFILDVRTLDEFRQGCLPGAIQLDVIATSFSQKLDELDRSKSYFVYCQSGKRSTIACIFMANKGFTRVFNLQGGLPKWPGQLSKPQRLV